MTVLKKRRVKGPKTSRLRASEITRSWHVVDLTGRPLGRVASEIAGLLLGKHKAAYEPHLVMGDYVIAINAAKVILTGNKSTEKKYYRHTGYPGGIKERTFAEQIQRDPRKVIEAAVKGMLPSGARGYAMLNSLKVYSGAEHPHQGQIGQTISPNSQVTSASKSSQMKDIGEDIAPAEDTDTTVSMSEETNVTATDTALPSVRLTRAVSAYKRDELDEEARALGIEIQNGWKKGDVYSAIQTYYSENPLEG